MNAVKQRKGDKYHFCDFPYLNYIIFTFFNFCRYDYLEFTDSRGGKVRYDMKVGTEKWPKV